MKNLFSLFFFIFIALSGFSQAPQKFSYQTVIRNAGNQLVANQQVGIKISILQGSANGSAVYAETHTPQTNANGLATLEIGGGTLLSGNFANINWANGPFFVKTETDPNGGNNYTITNTSQLLSVPYALYSSSANTANTANTAITAGNGVPAGGTNGQILTNCNGVVTWTTAGQCPETIVSLNCSTATNSGTLTQGVAAAGVSSNVPYTGSGGAHNGQTITSTGVSGLTATLAAGNFSNGAGVFTYTISGTPTSSGTASFALNIGGQTCTLTRTVALPNGTIASLNCSTATNTGSLTQGIAATSVSSSVPYTGGNGGIYAEQTIASTGVTGLTATLSSGTLLSGAGALTFTITGTPATSGTASFALSIGGQTCTLTRTVNTGGSGPLNIETALIPAGIFTMGSPTTEPGRLTDEVQHQVTLSAYRMSKYETSNAQFAAFLNARNVGSNGEDALGPFPNFELIYENPTFGLIWTGTQWQPVSGKENFPVPNVTWYGAYAFGVFAGGRLPTEAEWEYACRGNTSTAYSTGACLNYTQANYRWDLPLPGCNNSNTTYPNETQAIDSYSPNAYGLYNMHGNLFEWCSDHYGPYSTLPQTNPTGPSVGPYRVLRGGGYANNGITCRSAMRSSTGPVTGSNYFGFRLAFTP